MLRVSYVDSLDCINSDGVALTVWFQGCPFNCEGCHNQELKPFEGGTEFTAQELYSHLDNYYYLRDYKNIVLIGGEPLSQELCSLEEFLTQLDCFWGGKVWLYTGNDYSDVPLEIKEHCYCIKAGKYNPKDYPPVKGSKLASSNQHYYFHNGSINDNF